MKLKTDFKTLSALLLLIAGMIYATNSVAQISLVCTNPTGVIYGLTANGEIYPINVSNGSTGSAVKNGTYSNPGPSRANGMGYNIVNGRFYYFKRNVGSSTQQFVSFNPLLNIVSVLATSTCAAEVHTGCVNSAGTGYYTVDTDGNLNYYNITNNTWTFITGNIVDQFGADVDAVIRNQDAGDMAIDGWGRIWLVTSNSTNYGLYIFNGPLPTTPVASITVQRVIAPTATTPSGESFAGIAFSAGGQIYMGTKNDNRLYRLNTNFTLTFIGNLGTSDVGNDLTSCNFPFLVLPVSWRSFEVSAGKGHSVNLSWEVSEQSSKGYYVQHSLDGRNWEDITFIESQKDLVNRGGSLHQYSYSHTNHLDGKQYYRIKQVGEDDQENFSDIKSVTLENKLSVSIWPNPATNHIRVASASGNNAYTKARIFDLSGKMVSEKQLQTGTVNTISINALPAGTYIVRAETANGNAYVQKFNKQ